MRESQFREIGVIVLTKRSADQRPGRQKPHAGSLPAFMGPRSCYRLPMHSLSVLSLPNCNCVNMIAIAVVVAL